MQKLLRSLGELFLDTIETVVIALSIFLVVYLFFFQPHQVNGESMVPTFQNGEYLLTDKVSYKIREPRRGEVIVFHAPESAHCPQGTGCDFIKRIIAIPGETVEIRNSTFYIDGQALAESYIPPEYETKPGDFLKSNPRYLLKEGEYLAVGDNRPYSSDSRAWGPIDKRDIVGKAIFRYWPPQAMGLIKKTEY